MGTWFSVQQMNHLFPNKCSFIFDRLYLNNASAQTSTPRGMGFGLPVFGQKLSQNIMSPHSLNTR